MASRSKRAEIQYTASWFEAWAANKAAASPATDGVTRRRARAKTSRTLTQCRTRLVMWKPPACQPHTDASAAKLTNPTGR